MALIYKVFALFLQTYINRLFIFLLFYAPTNDDKMRAVKSLMLKYIKFNSVPSQVGRWGRRGADEWQPGIRIVTRWVNVCSYMQCFWIPLNRWLRKWSAPQKRRGEQLHHVGLYVQNGWGEAELLVWSCQWLCWPHHGAWALMGPPGCGGTQPCCSYCTSD